jgi:starch synthase (maltosyl-transferring)
MREYFRPNFFANTPDILPFYLQTGGRPGFVVRLVLAATLSPSYGIYSGFELCEAAALPEREEYLDSEKYEVKAWDWDRPGNIKPEITRLNALRRQSPALRLFANLAFHEADHDSVLFYRKSDADDHVLVLVNLDPHEAITCEIELPMAALGLAADALLVAIDALSGETVTLRGPRAAITLDPARNPTMVLGVSTPQ